MRRWFLLSALLLSLLPVAVNGQALPAGKGPGAYTSVGVAGSLFQSDYGKMYLDGLTVYADTHLHRFVGLEAEARFLRHPGNNAQSVSINQYMVGPRYSFKPVGWVPYVKMPVGLAHMNFPYGYATGNYFAMAPGGGIEYWLAGDNIRVRVADFEYQIWPQFTFGTMKPYGVSAGISFRVF